MHPLNAWCMRDVFVCRYSMDAAVRSPSAIELKPPVHVLTDRSRAGGMAGSM